MVKKILLLPGDGIGPEICAGLPRLFDILNQNLNENFTTETDYIGGSGYDQYGSPCTDDILEKARAADAILLGCVGGVKWEKLPYDNRPERGLLRLRKELDLFGNLRPAVCFDALADASSLKKELVAGLDILIVRELTGGVYFGEPRGVFDNPDGSRTGLDTQIYTSDEIQRIGRLAFDLAKKRSGRVTSCEKSNVMQSGLLWREEITEMHLREYPETELSHMYADNTAMQLVRQPKQFDVILTDNLFGDILSDVAAMLTGSLGMLPSASLGEMNPQTGRRFAMYEPVHGSAPDIAGKNYANPSAMLLSAAMMLRYSFNLNEAGEALENAVKETLKDGVKTRDIGGENSTEEMSDAILTKFSHLLQKRSKAA